MNTNTTRIVAAVVDTVCLTLYKEDGTTITIPQGDPRLRRILAEATPLLMQNGYADVVIELGPDNTYATFEKNQTNGLVKLFRIAKNKLKTLFAIDDPVEPVSIGLIAAEEQSELTKTMSAIDEIMQHAVPVSSESFDDSRVAKQANVVEECGDTPGKHKESDAPDTIIAVVDGQVISGMESIKTQFNRASAQGSTQGMEAFLQRIAKVVQQRRHSVEDLLKFMERGDLPIANDGSILIYKVLNRRSNNYVDCHTSKVEQWVGAYVCMDEKLVDPSRTNECSNGLHVARRGYIKGFSGDVCVLAKVAPEDVIAVPQYDANKMRVCGYHIIKELTEEQFAALRQNKPITSTESGKIFLAEAIAGHHINKTHEVRITEQQGGGVISKVIQAKVLQTRVGITLVPVEAINNPTVESEDVHTNPKDVVEQIAQLSRKEVAKQLNADYLAGKQGALEKLMQYKKAAKVSWEKLGVPDPTASPEVVVKPKKVKPVPKYVTPVKKVKVSHAVTVAQAIRANKGSSRERIQKLIAIGLTKEVAQAIYALKQKSKKNWGSLGVSPTEQAQIEKLLK